jgi:hypothetical protein
MRIYVEDLEPKNITRAHLVKMGEYYSGKNDVIEVFSGKGMYLVENSKMWKLVPTNDKTTKVVIEGISFLVDETNIEKRIHSQIPFDYSMNKKTIFTYHMRNIRLIVEGYYEENRITILNIDKIDADKSDIYNNFVVDNFYFEPKQPEKNGINNSFVKNEINVFLSILK